MEKRHLRGSSFVRHHRADTVKCDPTDDSEVDPMVAWRFSVRSTSPFGSAVKPRHRDVRAGFVQENQTRNGDVSDCCEVLDSSLADVFFVSLGGEDGLFFTV